MKTEFENLGYFKDYYVNKKFIGSKDYVEKDRDVFGYNGRKTERLTEDVVFKNGRKIKAGTEAVTELHILSGKIVNNI